jgi:hypothetical protein
MGYEIKLGEDGILYERQWGDISNEEAEEYKRETVKYLDAATGPLNVFVDDREVGKISSQARRTLASLSYHPNAGRVAMLGGINPYLAALVTFINKLTGKPILHFFQDEEKALAYVRGEDV